MLDFLVDPMTYGFMQRGLVAATLVGIVCAVMGAFVVLRGLAFIGDAVSHAAFPGLVIAYLLGIPLYIGGAIAAVGTALAIGAVARRGALRFDTAVGVLFAGMFAFGIVLFSTIEGYVTDLFSYLLGQRARDHLRRHRPDRGARRHRPGRGRVPAQGAALRVVRSGRRGGVGLPVVMLDYLLLGLVGVTIVVSIQAVGIIMVVAMLVTPAATGQLLVDEFWDLVKIAIAVAHRVGRHRALHELLPQRRVGRVDRPCRNALLRACACCSRPSRAGSRSGGRAARRRRWARPKAPDPGATPARTRPEGHEWPPAIDRWFGLSGTVRDVTIDRSHRVGGSVKPFDGPASRWDRHPTPIFGRLHDRPHVRATETDAAPGERAIPVVRPWRRSSWSPSSRSSRSTRPTRSRRRHRIGRRSCASGSPRGPPGSSPSCC